MYGEQKKQNGKNLSQISRVEQKHNFSHNADACLMILFSDSDIKSCELSPTRLWKIILVCNKNRNFSKHIPSQFAGMEQKSCYYTVNQSGNMSATSAHHCMRMCGKRFPITHKLHRQYLDLCWASSYKWIWSEINNYFTSIKSCLFFASSTAATLTRNRVCLVCVFRSTIGGFSCSYW